MALDPSSQLTATMTMSLLPSTFSQLILGRRLSKLFELRSMRSSDCRYFYEDVERFYYSVQRRSCHIEMVVAAKEGTRKPVFALVASKAASRKATIHVQATGKALSLQPDEYLRMLAAGLLAVQFYGLQTGATRVRVNKISPQLAGFFQALGYRLETRKRLLYAVRDIEAPTTH